MQRMTLADAYGNIPFVMVGCLIERRFQFIFIQILYINIVFTNFRALRSH